MGEISGVLVALALHYRPESANAAHEPQITVMDCDDVHSARLGTTPADDTRAANGSLMLLQPNGHLLHQHSLATLLIFAANVAAKSCPSYPRSFSLFLENMLITLFAYQGRSCCVALMVC